MKIRLRYTATSPDSVDGTFQETFFPDGTAALGFDQFFVEAMRLRQSLDAANYSVSDGLFSIVISGANERGEEVSAGHHEVFESDEVAADPNFLPNAAKRLVEEFVAAGGTASSARSELSVAGEARVH